MTNYNPDPLAFPDGWCDRCRFGPECTIVNCDPSVVEDWDWTPDNGAISCRRFFDASRKQLEPRDKKPGLSISFGWTADQLLAGKKTVTRRRWKATHVRKFLNLHEKGDWCCALDKSYRRGGKQIGWLRLTHYPYPEKLADMPEEDLAAEGFPELSKQEFIASFFEGKDDLEVWVVRFEFRPLDTSHTQGDRVKPTEQLCLF